ncbi:hypothetical protein BN946_scf184934.g3 [Trametes cinnabarina]|uniref:BZIP domain-containing protein n=1 Tax=Pycnoporus cinnabarinus TaxID=5643 RepID=A0A060STP5_PYCCI|nr:hypothetical protein BN946_scf184934.g3 [Trametes cinnabarina]
MSSSKRGRKRNDNLPPNRARDVQRAFRARRAAHLEALEQRVAELEEENNTLRAALNLPPANRPPLGRGPTGKDKPKTSTSKSPPAVAGVGAYLPSVPSLTSSGTLPPMSRTESPLSTGSTSAHSMSPDPVLSSALPLPQPTTHDLDPTGWSESMFGTKESNPPLPASPFSLPPSGASLGRSTTSDLFGGSVQGKFPGFSTSDAKSFGYLPSDERRTFPYPHSLLSGQPPSLQTPNGTNGGGDAAAAGGAEHPSSLPAFLQRRSVTEPDSYRTLLNQMSHIPSTQNALHTPIPRMSASTLLTAVDSHMSEYDLPGGAERRYPRLH